MRTMRTQTLVTCAMLVAVGVVTSFIVDIPLIPAAPFLKYDPSGVAMLLASLLYGPVAGAIVSILTCVIHWSADGPIGVIMNILCSLSMVIPAGLLFKRLKGRKGGLIISLAASGVSFVAGSIIFNLILTPIYLGVPTQVVIALIVPALLPFNAVKALLNAVLAAIIYAAVARFLGTEKGGGLSGDGSPRQQVNDHVGNVAGADPLIDPNGGKGSGLE